MHRPWSERGASARTLVIAALAGLAALVPNGAGLGSTSATFTATATATWQGGTRAACTPTNPYPATLASPALLPTTWWRFDTVTGATTVNDLTGHGNAGTVVDSGLVFGPGSGGLIPCDTTASMHQPGGGSQGFVTLATARPAPTAYTIATWVMSSSLSGGRLVSFGDSASGASTAADRAVLLDLAGHPVFHVATTSGPLVLTAPVPVADSALHLVVATFDGAVAQLYVDGRAAATSLPVTPVATYTGFWRAGWDQGAGALVPGAADQADVSQDEIALWEGRALTSGEVATLWASNHW